MVWLTDKEREENKEADEASKKRGFSNAYEEMKSRFIEARNKLVEKAKQKLSKEELEAIISWARER